MLNGTEKNKEDINTLIEKTIRKYADMIFRLAFQYTGNVVDAQDILQEVSLTLVSGKPPYNDEAHLRNWLCRVTVNKCRNLYKHKKIYEWQELKEDSAVYESEFPFIKDELYKLPVKYRTVLYLYYFEEYSIKEIAKILGVNQNTIGARLRRGRDKLRIILTEGE